MPRDSTREVRAMSRSRSDAVPEAIAKTGLRTIRRPTDPAPATPEEEALLERAAAVRADCTTWEKTAEQLKVDRRRAGSAGQGPQVPLQTAHVSGRSRGGPRRSTPGSRRLPQANRPGPHQPGGAALGPVPGQHRPDLLPASQQEAAALWARSERPEVEGRDQVGRIHGRHDARRADAVAGKFHGRPCPQADGGAGTRQALSAQKGLAVGGRPARLWRQPGAARPHAASRFGLGCGQSTRRRWGR